MTKTEVDCVFCKITCGETLSFKIYEDDTCVFILDSKFQPTDLLVVAAMSVKVPFLSNAIMKSTRCDLPPRNSPKGTGPVMEYIYKPLIQHDNNIILTTSYNPSFSSPPMASSSSNNNNNNNMDSLHDGRSLFERLIINTARAPYRVVEMISLWLSNFAPQSSFIHQILSMSDPEIDLVPVEAELILDSLLPGHSSSDDDNDVPITTGLLNMSMNIQYFIINRDSVFEGMSDILSSLRSMVSEDLATRMNGGLNVSYRVGGLQIKANNEAGSSDGIARVDEDNDEDGDSDEDGNSDENNDSDEDEDDGSDEDDDAANEHERTLLLVFPTGISFTKEELREFFIRGYAAIEWVIFPNTPPNSSPKFARIVFFTPMALDMVLGNSNLVELEIEGKCLWARRFRIQMGGYEGLKTGN